MHRDSFVLSSEHEHKFFGEEDNVIPGYLIAFVASKNGQKPRKAPGSESRCVN